MNGVTRIVASDAAQNENHFVEATLSFDGGPMEHISLEAYNRTSGSGLSLRVADNRHHQYSFILTLRFPAGYKYSWVESRVFSTEPKKWDHVVDDLEKHQIAFERISLTAVHGNMNVKVILSRPTMAFERTNIVWLQALKADNAELRTNIGSIHGHFNVSQDALKLSAHIG